MCVNYSNEKRKREGLRLKYAKRRTKQNKKISFFFDSSIAPLNYGPWSIDDLFHGNYRMILMYIILFHAIDGTFFKFLNRMG